MRDLRLRLLSWNVHALAWPLSRDPGGRMDRVAAKIRELSPEVVLLQEVWFGAHAERLARALSPDWAPVCIRRRGRGPRGGLLTFVGATAEWRVRAAPEFQPFAASAPAWRVWEGDGLGGKGVLTVDLERGEQRVCTVNTHLQSQYPGLEYAAVREAQLSQVREVVSRLDASMLTIVAGDLNTDSSEPLYSRIAALGRDLTVAAREISNDGTIANPDNKRAEWIDYIIAVHPHQWSVSAALALIANERADFPYSDHSGLVCDLSIAPRDGADALREK